ncbi:MAG: hypothetical protein ACMXX8_00350 [Candidatus Woesearchaeota archaeon]
MKKITIIEPHYDDAWINLGGFILNNLNSKIQIITLTQNPSNDSFEKEKLLKLSPNISHVSLNFISLGFDNDYYEKYYRSKIMHNDDLDLFLKLNKIKNLDLIINTLEELVKEQDEIYFPMSLKHPQHLLSRYMIPKTKCKFYIYREYPYYFYESEKNNILNFNNLIKDEIKIDITNIKEKKYLLFKEFYPLQKFILDLKISGKKLEDIDDEMFWEIESSKYKNKIKNKKNKKNNLNDDIANIVYIHNLFRENINFDFSEWLNLKPIRINKSVKEEINLLSKVLKKYLLLYVQNTSIEEIYDKLNLSVEERKLISLDISKNNNLNFFRVDFGFENGYYKFFEINTECPGGFGDLSILEKIISKINNEKIRTSQKIGLEFKKLFLKNFIEEEIYIVFSDKEKDEQIINELKIFVKKYLSNYFKINYIFLEDISLENNKIKYQGKKIKQIFRMFDLVDLIKYINVDDFIQIYKKENIIVVNPFSDALFGHKKIILLLLNKYGHIMKRYLKEDYNLIFGNYSEFDKNNTKNKVLKKGFSTRGNETFFLNDIDKNQLMKILYKNNLNEYIVQNEFNIDEIEAIFLDISKKELKIKKLKFDYLPFFINSKNCGAFSRLSDTKLTNHFWKNGGISTIDYK